MQTHIWLETPSGDSILFPVSILKDSIVQQQVKGAYIYPPNFGDRYFVHRNPSENQSALLEIEELIDALSKDTRGAGQQWLDVDKARPAVGESVLVCNSGDPVGEIDIRVYLGEELKKKYSVHKFASRNKMDKNTYYYTHWMPLQPAV